MTKKTRFLLIFFPIVIVILQLFQPVKNEEAASGNHLYHKTNVPESVHTILDHACMDCHSNQTNYQWYHRISPISWYINHHITEGKGELNFSEWGAINPIDQISALEDIRKEVDAGKMPLKSYQLIHKDARLNHSQTDSLVSWIKNYQGKIADEAMR